MERGERVRGDARVREGTCEEGRTRRAVCVRGGAHVSL